MIAKWKQFVMVGWILVVLSTSTLGQTVVYDNTTNDTGVEFTVNLDEIGDEITLAGTGRVVTRFEILLGLEPDAEGMLFAEVKFYTNDGQFGGSPGTLLWQSGFAQYTIDPMNPEFIEFNVPKVQVPDTFIWILSGGGENSTLLRRPEFYPPTVGSARFGHWYVSLGPIPWLFIFDRSPFAARVTVEGGSDIPIPTLSKWGMIVMVLLLLTIFSIKFGWRLPRPPSVGDSVSCTLAALLGLVACISVASAQVKVGPQIRIDANGGTAAANETSIAGSGFNNNNNEIVAAWNDYRGSYFDIEIGWVEIGWIGVAVSNDGGATWTDYDGEDNHCIPAL